jgi:hypothetical protein
MSEGEGSDRVDRWTAKRRLALVLSIVKGETSAAEAAREHGLTVAEIEGWKEQFLLGAEKALRSKPKDEEALPRSGLDGSGAIPVLSFDRVLQSRIAGCAVYLLTLPVLVLIGAIFGAAGGYGLARIFPKAQLEAPLMLGLGGLGSLLAVGYVLRDFRRQFGTRIQVHEDRLEVVSGGEPQVFPFRELEWIRGTGLGYLSRLKGTPLPQAHAVRLKGRDGRVLLLRLEEWPLVDLARALLDRAVPVMADQMSARMAAGETLQFRPSISLALGFLVLGLLGVGLGIFGLIAAWERYRKEGRFEYPRLLVFLSLMGAGALVGFWRSRGGIELGPTGVGRPGSGSPYPWDRIRQLHELPDALSVEIEGGPTLSVGMMARNYDVCLELLRRRLGTRS